MKKNQKKVSSKLWHSQRFSEGIDKITLEYTASVGFDRRLANCDITASIAHAQMLAKQKIINEKDLAQIEKGFSEIRKEVEAGEFLWSIKDEDVHMNLEKRLIEKIGEAGRRLHTARSRNDQVATDIRLYLREEIDNICQKIRKFQKVIINIAEKNTDTIMPGYTHLQVAQPISFAHHLMAYFEMFERDYQRMQDVRKRVNILPLGSAALAGTTFNIDRKMVMKKLKFSALSENSLDAVSDRDFAIEFLAGAGILMMHISRLSEELILWMNPLFNFVNIPDKYCTTSSIMPQKKNPDIPELARGKSARVYGNLISLLTLMKAQPLAYNKDNQEDKEPLFDSIDTVINTLSIFTDMLAGLKINNKKMRAALNFGHASATDLADFLVGRGLAFRTAHGIVAQAVSYAEKHGKDLSDLTKDELITLIPELSKSTDSANSAVLKMKLETVLSARNHIGGTAPRQVKMAINRAKARIKR